jgi:hypothetical protein
MIPNLQLDMILQTLGCSKPRRYARRSAPIMTKVSVIAVDSRVRPRFARARPALASLGRANEATNTLYPIEK